MAGAGDEAKELGCGVEEVDHLGDEEEQHGLAEVAQDPRDSKSHPCKVAECVTDKDPRGVPGEGGREEGREEGREGGREGGREEGKEGGKEGGRERGRKREREGGREGEREDK